MTGVRITLRPVVEADLDVMERFATEPDALGEFEWGGFTDPTVTRRRWEEDRLLAEDSSFLAIVLDDHMFIGYVIFRDASGSVTRGAPKRRSPIVRYAIGIVLLPEHRGKGYGTDAQRQLVDYLFRTSTVHRIEASTEAGNVAEQRALEKVGFRQEGVARAAGYRNGHWVDGVLYGILREDPR